MRVPRSQRGGEVVEPLVREQWFIRMRPLAEPAIQVTLSSIQRLIICLHPLCLAAYT